ncbi:MAG: molybdopterin cofactor-binding domain-containing protein [Usitatibacter sp.]
MNARREFLQQSGALVVSFAISSRALAQMAANPVKGKLPGSLNQAPWLDSWIRIDADNRVTVFTGKAELGQGVKTALMQIAAEELDVDFARVTLVTADTGATPNEGFTAGSNSMKDSGTALRNAAAQVREILLARASIQLAVAADGLEVQDGIVVARDGRRITYGELVAGEVLHIEAKPTSRFKDPKSYRLIGKPVKRVEIPGKVTGAESYVHDLRLPGMQHARVIRPPSYGAMLESVDTREVEAMGAKVVRDANFLAVVAPKEYTAVKAMWRLRDSTKWSEHATLPDMKALPATLLAMPSQDVVIEDRSGTGTAAKTLEATYTRNYMAHGSIGPSCAVAHVKDGALTVWSHTQGVYPDRDAIAEMLGMPKESVRVIHREGAGCYGHNGADDAAGDAALIAARMPGIPVRVQWMREDEHRWEPFGSAMVGKVRASLDDSGRIVSWDYGVWSCTHSTRPGGAASLLAAQHGARAFRLKPQKATKTVDGLGDRNAIPSYNIPSMHVVHHFLPDMPLRVSAMRGLGAYHNVFALESFMDELALAAGADPVEFRLRHLDDPRSRAVVERVASGFNWSAAHPAPGRGKGFAFARYKNYAAYCAVAVEVAIDPHKGLIRLVRAVAAIDSGQVVNPDGLRNQTEGGIIQSASWTLHEKVAFDRTRIRSFDWSTYPILRFDGVPESLEVHVIDRPGLPWLGSGEAAAGPTAGAIGNAVANATGRRLRDLPLVL